MLRARIEAVEAVPLHPYLQAILAFSFAAASEALETFRDDVAGWWEEATSPVRELIRAIGTSAGFDHALATLGWAYAVRAAEVSWLEDHEEVVQTLTRWMAVPPTAEAIVAYGAIADDAVHSAQIGFQATVFRSVYEAVAGSRPTEDLATRCARAWLFAWTEGWAAFGKLLGEYERAPRPTANEVTTSAGQARSA